MIMSRFDFIFPPQFIRHLLAFDLGSTVNNPTLTLMMILDERSDFLDDFLALGSNFVFEVGSIEGLGEGEATAHTEVVEDVSLDSIVGGGGESDERNSGVILLQTSHLLVVRPWRRCVSISVW